MRFSDKVVLVAGASPNAGLGGASAVEAVTPPVDCRQVRELYTGKILPVSGRQFRYAFKMPDTALFEPIW